MPMLTAPSGIALGSSAFMIALNTPLVAEISKLAIVAPRAPPMTMSSAVTFVTRNAGLTPWVTAPSITQTSATMIPTSVAGMSDLFAHVVRSGLEGGHLGGARHFHL